MNLLHITLSTLSITLLMLLQPSDAGARPLTKVIFSDSIAPSREIDRQHHSALKDTINALENLFKRKRRFGFIKTIVFGSAALYSVNHTLHPSEASSNKGWQKDLEEDATIFTICAGTMLVLNGTFQVFRYSKSTLKTIVEDRYHGIPFPKELIAKLKPSDFR
jgi:hypothetical protein